MSNFIKKRWDLLLLIFLMVTSFFIRSYEFDSFLLFRSDQERDARIARIAFENGPEYLRLLGPKISKVELAGDKVPDTSNLGPYYYYCQYFFSLIFQSVDPWVFVLPDFILSLLAIGLFYFLLREFFPKIISIATTAIFSFSFVLLQYSRFAWNPNQLVFWSLLFLLSIYKTVTEEHKKRKIIWFLLSFLSVLVLSQLHVIALFGFPLIMVIFWFLNKPNLKWKHWALALGMVLVFYFPVFVSEYANHGDNTKRFFALFGQEGSEKNLSDNFIEAGENYGMFYSLAITTFNKHNFEFIEITAIVFIVASLVLIFFFFLKKRKEDRRKSVFLLLLIIYFIVFFAIYIKTAERIYRPRYWMSTACLPYIFIALWFYLIEKNIKIKKLGQAIIILITVVIIGLNFYAVYWFYGSLRDGMKLEMPLRGKTQIRPYREMINYKQLKAVVDIMAIEAQNKKNQLCFSYDESQFKRGTEYLLENYHPEVDFINTENIESIKRYDCAIFVITDYDDEEKDLEDGFVENFEIEKTSIIKPLKLWQFKNRIDIEVVDRIDSLKDAEIIDKIKEEKVYYWKEIFNKK